MSRKATEEMNSSLWVGNRPPKRICSHTQTGGRTGTRPGLTSRPAKTISNRPTKTISNRPAKEMNNRSTKTISNRAGKNISNRPTKEMNDGPIKKINNRRFTETSNHMPKKNWVRCLSGFGAGHHFQSTRFLSFWNDCSECHCHWSCG
jgi:hypothetical protein